MQVFQKDQQTVEALRSNRFKINNGFLEIEFNGKLNIEQIVKEAKAINNRE